MQNCTCGDKMERKLYTNDCLVCGKPFIYKRDLTDVYKFRAECLADVTGFLNNLWPGCRLLWVRVDVAEPGMPDCTVEVKIEGTDLEEMRICLSGVEDGHVMFESLNHAKDYTGERRFSRGEGV